MILDARGNPVFVTKGKQTINKYWSHRATRFNPNYGNNIFANHCDVDTSITSDLDTQYSLAEELFANHPLIKSVINNLVSHATLTGFSFSMDTGIREVDEAIERHFKRWSKKYVDSNYRWNLNQLVEITIRNYYLYGQSFGLISTPRANAKSINPYGLFFKGISPTSINYSNWNQKNKNEKIIHGIQKDASGSPVAIYLDLGNGKHKKIPYRDTETGEPIVLQTYQPGFFNQSHGICPITACYNTSLDLSMFQASEVQAAINSSSINLIATTKTPERINSLSSGAYNMGGTTEDNPPIYKPIVSANAGNAIQLLEGESIEQLKLERPNQMYEPFIKTNLDIICRCFDADRKYLFCDWENSNYASQRLSALQTQSQFAKMHKLVIDTMLQPLIDSFIRVLVAEEFVNIQSLDIDDVLESYTIRPPKLPLLDMEREAKVSKMLVDSNFSTYQRETERLIGQDYKSVFTQRKKENEDLNDNELTESELDDNPTHQQGKPPGAGSTRS